MRTTALFWWFQSQVLNSGNRRHSYGKTPAVSEKPQLALHGGTGINHRRFEGNQTRDLLEFEGSNATDFLLPQAQTAEHFEVRNEPIKEKTRKPNVVGVETDFRGDMGEECLQYRVGQCPLRESSMRSEQEGKELFVPDVPTNFFQDDGWSCGVRCSTRVLLAYGYDVSYQIQRSNIGPLPFSFEWNFCAGSGFSCKVSFSIPNRLVGMGRPPSNLAEKLRGLGFQHWKHENGGTVERLKQLIDQNRPIVAMIRVNDVYSLDFCHDFGSWIGEYCLLSVTLPGLHYITLVGYNEDGFMCVDTRTNAVATYPYASFDNDWNFKGWRSGFVYDLYWRVGAKPRSFLYFDQPLIPPTPGCNCECCCPDGCFCLVPCGCSCKVPPSASVSLKVENNCRKKVFFDAYIRSISPADYNSAFTDSVREGTWQWSASSDSSWWALDAGSGYSYDKTNTLQYYFFAYEPTTGYTWGGSDQYVDKGERRYGLREKTIASLGTTSSISLICSGLPSERFRIYVRNSCEWYGDLRAILSYDDSESLSREEGSWIVPDDETEYLLAQSSSRYFFYYATDVSTEAVQWTGTDYYVTFGGQSYGLRRVDMGSEFKKYTLSLTCTCTPVDCTWGSWGPWSACSFNSQIDLTIQSRTRTHFREKNACGAECQGPFIEWLECDLAPDPTPHPTQEPTSAQPTPDPTREPTGQPTPDPTGKPTPAPTSKQPTPPPTTEPIPSPTQQPSLGQSQQPTPDPTRQPTQGQFEEPTGEPSTGQPLPEPTMQSTPDPTRMPAPDSTPQPSTNPRPEPTQQPSVDNAAAEAMPGPSQEPSLRPSTTPSNPISDPFVQSATGASGALHRQGSLIQELVMILPLLVFHQVG